MLKLPEKKKKTCHNKYTNFPKYISILGKRDVKTAKLPTWSISNFNSELLNFNLITFGSRTTNSFMPHETNPISFWVSNPRHSADCSHSRHSTRCPVLPSGNSQSQHLLFRSPTSQLLFYPGACACTASKCILCQGFRQTHVGTTHCPGSAEQSWQPAPPPQTGRGQHEHLGLTWGHSPLHGLVC